MPTGEIAIRLSNAATRVSRVAQNAIKTLKYSDRARQILIIVGVVVVLLAAGAALVAYQLNTVNRGQEADEISLPLTPPGMAAQTFTLAPDEIRALEPDAARTFNAGIPFSTLPILAARPFIMTPEKIDEYSRALDCLTAAIYYEAASETTEGQAAVAQVVLNRMRHPAYPNTVCGVVFQGSERVTGCQFSFTCDGAMARVPSIEGWARAKAVAGAALNGSVAANVGMATHYHTDWVAPYWAERLVKMKQIGTHIFYRWTGSWGLPFAFSRVHTGSEPIIAKMAALSTPLDVLAPPIDLLPLIEAPEPILIVEAPPPPAPEPEVQAAAPAPAPVVVAQRAPPPPAAIANPLATPTDARPPRRSRIAVPSGW